MRTARPFLYDKAVATLQQQWIIHTALFFFLILYWYWKIKNKNRESKATGRTWKAFLSFKVDHFLLKILDLSTNLARAGYCYFNLVFCWYIQISTAKHSHFFLSPFYANFEIIPIYIQVN